MVNFICDRHDIRGAKEHISYRKYYLRIPIFFLQKCLCLSYYLLKFPNFKFETVLIKNL